MNKRDRHRNFRIAARVLAVVSLGVLPLGFAVADSSGSPYSSAAARKTTAPICRAKAKRLRPGRISFSFSCGSEDVTSFYVQANRALHALYEPNSAFGCSRSTSRSFLCEDIHSGAGPEGAGVLTVSGPLCRRGAQLVLRITPTLNFEAQPGVAFTLKGPC